MLNSTQLRVTIQIDASAKTGRQDRIKRAQDRASRDIRQERHDGQQQRHGERGNSGKGFAKGHMAKGGGHKR